METMTVPAPDPVDGWFLSIHLNNETGEDFYNKLYYLHTQEILIDVTGMSQAVKDALPAAVVSYVHPEDTTKNMYELVLEDMNHLYPQAQGA